MWRYYFLLLSIFLCLFHETHAYGRKEILFNIPNSDRQLVAEIYFPTDAEKSKQSIVHGIWHIGHFVKDVPMSTKGSPFPLVIFSHGWQGDRFGHAWLAEMLVDAGFLVAMIDHTHNTSYEHSDAFIYSNMWQRPIDLSALLDYLLASENWKYYIDLNRIAVGGFSLGGLTALWLAGIKAEPQAFKAAMESYSRWDDWPNAIVEDAKKVDWQLAGRSYHDPRVRAAFSIAPDLGKGFKVKGLQKAKVPTLIMVGDEDRVTPSISNAAFFQKYIPQANLIILEGAAHFTFLNQCSTMGRKLTPHLCEDKPSIQRTDIHELAGSKIVQFLEKHLS